MVFFVRINQAKTITFFVLSRFKNCLKIWILNGDLHLSQKCGKYLIGFWIKITQAK